MPVKLTLSISDEETVAKIKEYAAEHDTSLSSLVEELFESLLLPKQKKQKLSPRVKLLLGFAKTKDKRDYREMITEEIMKKHSKHVRK